EAGDQARVAALDRRFLGATRQGGEVDQPQVARGAHDRVGGLDIGWRSERSSATVEDPARPVMVGAGTSRQQPAQRRRAPASEQLIREANEAVVVLALIGRS